MIRRVASSIFKPIAAGPTNLLRIICGFLLAPFLVTVPFTLVERGFAGFSSALALSALAFPVTVAIGLPTYLLLRWTNLLRWYHFAIAGTLAASLPLVGVYLATNIRLYSSLEFPQLTAMLVAHGKGIAAAGLFGSLVALAFWLLVHSRFQLMPAAKEGTSGTPAL